MIPKQAKPHKNNHIAEGEHTGHFHAAEGAAVLEHDGTLYVDASDGSGQVTHQEHGTIALPPGTYETGGVRELDHFTEEARRVAD